MEGIKMADENVVDPNVGGGLGSLFQNKLFLQYLAGAGADIAAGKGLGPSVNAITQQNIQSQNMMKLMKQLLGPDGSKATISNAGMNLTIPPDQVSKSLLGNIDGVGFDPSNPAVQTPVIPSAQVPAAPAAPVPTIGGGSAAPNPFAGSSNLDFSASDLAGLTTQDISAALGMKMQQTGQAADNIYKSKLMENIDSEIAARAGKDTSPEQVKLYQYAQSQGYKGSYMDFKDSGVPSIFKEYDKAMADPKFRAWLKETNESKATRISLGEKLSEMKAKSGLSGQLYFDDPKWTDDIDKQVKAFDKDQAWLMPEGDRPLARNKLKARSIRDKVLAGGGTILKAAVGKDGIETWTVKWPSGDTKDIKISFK